MSQDSMGEMPQQPARSDSANSGTVLPSALIDPIPVIATRRIR
jgi:hypothetical protein